jgi:long-chain acyl-CoA synthetase
MQAEPNREITMHPYHHAQTNPDKVAYVMAGSGEKITYGELETRSNKGAQLFRKWGLQTGDVLAILMENHPRYLEIAWAAQRSGLYFVCISSRLQAREVRYIVEDSNAKALITSAAIEVVDELPAMLPNVRLATVGTTKPLFEDYDIESAKMPDSRIADESEGKAMLYSSGTTGRPKGVKMEITGASIDTPNRVTERMIAGYGFTRDSVYLSPAPLYHASPLHWSMGVHRIGGTVVVMEKFDAENALALIEKYKVDRAQFVPTHFVRMLKLPAEVRAKYDVTSLKCVMHSAAPCPIPVKEQMMEWWGPIIWEYYSGTEHTGMTYIGPEEWLAHKGSVGRAVLGQLRIVGEDGEVLPPRTEGQIYFEGGNPIRYHNAPEKAAESTNSRGWTTLGDVGWVDEEGYLYLTDRKSFMIISGGVNVYPQEIENLLITHPKVADAAVVGAPDEEMGEKVVAVIQLLDPRSAGDEARREIVAWLKPQLSGVKMPRQIDFMDELPRHPTGKLYKRLIRDTYWAKSGAKTQHRPS